MTPSAVCLLIGTCFSTALQGCGRDATTAAPAPTPAPTPAPLDIVDLVPSISTNPYVVGHLTKFVAALKKAELVDTLKEAGPFTVFVPGDRAFEAKFPGTAFDALTKAQLIPLLKYHIISGAAVKSTDLVTPPRPPHLGPGQPGEGQTWTTLDSSKQIALQVGNTLMLVGFTGRDAIAVNADNVASNGVVHIIDTVLDVPDDIVELAEGNALTKLVAALKKAELVDTLKEAGPFTVFAPTDAAFEAKFPGTAFDALTKAQLIPVLQYHVIFNATFKSTADLIDGSQKVTTLNNKELTIYKPPWGLLKVGFTGTEATMTNANNWASNGVVHIIDRVLEVPTAFLTLV